jgi:hypothetical protein
MQVDIRVVQVPNSGYSSSTKSAVRVRVVSPNKLLQSFQFIEGASSELQPGCLFGCSAAD